MRYRISQIKLEAGENISRLRSKIEKKTGAKISGMKIIRESVDAREKPRIYRVYTVDFDCGKRLDLPPAEAPEYVLPKPGEVCLESMKNGTRPVIIGFGPCGMFAGLILARAGLRPVIIERGSDVDSRTRAVQKFWEQGVLDPECNVQFGEGGAGTFSDGKLNTGIKDGKIAFVLRELAEHGAPEDITYQAKPHVGTDILRTVVRNIREEIISLGGEVRFNEKVIGLTEDRGRLTGVLTDKSTEPVETDCAVLSIGHSSRDTFKWLRDMGMTMEQKPFSIGVRIQHPQELIDVAQYGAPAEKLGLSPADYKLNYRCENGRGVYTFCMCPGGQVIKAASEPGMTVTNGMSLRARDSGIANSALLVDVDPRDFGSEDVLAGVEFQRKYERLAFINGGGNYDLPQCTWGELLSGRGEKVAGSIPEFALDAMKEAMPHFGKKIRGFDSPEALLTAVESRSSSPVRIKRNEHCVGMLKGSPLEGFYPAGEGAGYAGGITSAAVDGIRAAEAILGRKEKNDNN